MYPISTFGANVLAYKYESIYKPTTVPEYFNHLIESLVLGHQGMLSLLHLTNLQAYFDLNNTVLSCILIINTASITLNALAGATPSSFIPLHVGNYTRCSRAPSHATPNSISCNRSTGSVSCSLVESPFDPVNLKVATAGSLWTSGPLEIIQPSLRLDNRWLRSILRPLSQYILFPNARFLEEKVWSCSGIRRTLYLNPRPQTVSRAICLCQRPSRK